MHINTKWRRGAIATAAVAAVAAGSMGLAAPAMADPVGAPTYRALAGVGSDTTQDVMNGVASVVKNSSGTLLIGSYDATGSSPISTKSGNSFARPDGSGNGLKALRSAKDNTSLWDSQNLTSNDLQFSRSSSAPKPADLTSTGRYSYVPFALDAVSYAKAPSGSAVPSNIPLGTNVDDLSSDGVTLALTLKNIYSRNATTTLKDASGTSFTVGAQGSGAQIVPFKPQEGSGTLSFWTGQVGGTLGSIVKDNYSYTTSSTECATNPTITTGGVTYPTFTGSTCTAAVQEHNGKVTAKVTNATVPFSIAQYLAQGNSTSLASKYGITVTDRRNSAVLGQVDGINTTVLGRLNTNFPIRRVVFNVVEHAELSTNADLAAVFQGSTASAYNATSSTGSLVITDFGFGDIRGGVTLPGSSTVYTAGDTTSFRIN